MFDSKLFYDLCEKYGVELSDKYSEPMIKVNGEIIPLREYEDIIRFYRKHPDVFCEKMYEMQTSIVSEDINKIVREKI